MEANVTYLWVVQSKAGQYLQKPSPYNYILTGQFALACKFFDRETAETFVHYVNGGVAVRVAVAVPAGPIDMSARYWEQDSKEAWARTNDMAHELALTKAELAKAREQGNAADKAVAAPLQAAGGYSVSAMLSVESQLHRQGERLALLEKNDKDTARRLSMLEGFAIAGRPSALEKRVARLENFACAKGMQP